MCLNIMHKKKKQANTRFLFKYINRIDSWYYNKLRISNFLHLIR